MTDRKPLKCGAIELAWDGDGDWSAETESLIFEANEWERPTIRGNRASVRVFVRFSERERRCLEECQGATAQEAADDLAKFLRGLCGELVAGGFGKS